MAIVQRCSYAVVGSEDVCTDGVTHIMHVFIFVIVFVLHLCLT